MQLEVCPVYKKDSADQCTAWVQCNSSHKPFADISIKKNTYLLRKYVLFTYCGVSTLLEINKHRIESPVMFSYQDVVRETWNIN